MLSCKDSTPLRFLRKYSLFALSALFILPTLCTPLLAWEKALAPYPFHFPADHGSHPQYQTEWWYLTGRLTTPQNRHFGYQFTIFRQGLIEKPDPAAASPWQVRDLYILHCALSDIDSGKFYQHQDISRAGPELAGARQDGMQTWVKGSRLVWDESAKVLQLKVASPEYQIELELKPSYPPILHGNRGLSAKGSLPGQASHYYSWPRLQGRGELRLREETFPVTSLSWLDREFATNQLGQNQAGWDWFALHFDDGQALMLYRMRLKNGGQDDTSSGTWIFADGSSRHLTNKDFTLQPKKPWRSPQSGAEYPLNWQITLQQPQPLTFAVSALLDSQEMRTGATTLANYWEGAVTVNGRRLEGSPISGHGYLEMTGYDQALEALQKK
ncbi:MAG: carotenoid 1,2-hydratase [Deltaproteobacteria bacterium]|nr:carotenoid 1,2-hydratase [Deltaproteobacteria bacterium]